jgi:DNA-directed RNA polymerase subunit H (RpoH/RPB5)
LCTIVKSLTLLNDTVSVNDVSGCGTKYPLLSSNLKISYSADAVGPTPWKLYVPKNEPVNNGENIKLLAVIWFNTTKLPSIEDDVFTTNPKFGDILAIVEPDCSSDVSNAKLAILMLVIPLPSPINDEPDDIITLPPVTNNPPLTLKLPDTNVFVFISKPLF